MGRRKNAVGSALRALLLPAGAAAVLLCFAVAVDSLDRGRQEEEIHRLEESLRRACVACYAEQGVYPPDLDYLKEHYGLQIDDERFTVRYDAFAENLMPDITVLEKAK